jgi:probable HAF family extracellular repeat protein
MGTTKAVLLLAAILAAGPVAAGAQQYTVTNLGILDGYSNSYASGVNERGQVTGYSSNNNPDVLAFLYSDGTLQDLGTLGGAESAGYAINAIGEVVGFSLDAANANQVFLQQRIHAGSRHSGWVIKLWACN